MGRAHPLLAGDLHASVQMFVGRQEQRRALRNQRVAADAAGNVGATVHIVCGRVGIGKTALVRDYVGRNRSGVHKRYPGGVFWADGLTSATLSASLAAAVPAGEAPVPWLAARADWLLVVDGVEEHAVLAPLYPMARARGHIVITTRIMLTSEEPPAHPLVPAAFVPQCMVMELPPLPWREAVALLCSVRWGEALSGVPSPHPTSSPAPLSLLFELLLVCECECECVCLLFAPCSGRGLCARICAPCSG